MLPGIEYPQVWEENHLENLNKLTDLPGIYIWRTLIDYLVCTLFALLLRHIHIYIVRFPVLVSKGS